MNSLLSRITINSDICHGKPVIRNLRYPVESMLEYLAGGDAIEDVLAEFPDLEREDLLACLEFAAQSLRVKSQHLVLANPHWVGRLPRNVLAWAGTGAS